MRLKAVGIAAGIVISTAAAAENADWFGERLFDAFADDLRSPAYEAPAPDASPQQRRIPPAPFDSPPFPSADWQIGGTPIIGDANNIAPWPPMEAILRNEFYNDIAGSRTGHATKYSEHSLGVTWWPDKFITLRPELRFDHSYDTAAFDNGARRNQLVGSMDVIIHY